MITLACLKDGFSIYDYKKGLTGFFRIVDDNQILINLNRQYSDDSLPLLLEIRESDNDRFFSFITELYDQQIMNNNSSIQIEQDQDMKGYKVSLLDNNNNLQNGNITFTISKDSDQQAFRLYARLINQTMQLPITRDEFVRKDFETYVTNRDLWFSQTFLHLQQSEDACLLAIFSELCDLEKHSNRKGPFNQNSLLNGLRYAKEDLQKLQSTKRKISQLVTEELERKDQLCKQLRCDEKHS